MIYEDIKVWAVMARLAGGEGMDVAPLVALARRVEVVEKALLGVIEAARDPDLSDAGLITRVLAMSEDPALNAALTATPGA